MEHELYTINNIYQHTKDFILLIIYIVKEKLHCFIKFKLYGILYSNIYSQFYDTSP